MSTDAARCVGTTERRIKLPSVTLRHACCFSQNTFFCSRVLVREFTVIVPLDEWLRNNVFISLGTARIIVMILSLIFIDMDLWRDLFCGSVSRIGAIVYFAQGRRCHSLQIWCVRLDCCIHRACVEPFNNWNPSRCSSWLTIIKMTLETRITHVTKPWNLLKQLCCISMFGTSLTSIYCKLVSH